MHIHEAEGKHIILPHHIGYSCFTMLVCPFVLTTSKRHYTSSLLRLIWKGIHSEVKQENLQLLIDNCKIRDLSYLEGSVKVYVLT